MSDIDFGMARIRTWILLAIDACDRSGLTPIGKTRFHRLIFLTNCLAELFELNPPSKHILKYRRGPFYPDVQWQLDRLSSMGLLEPKNFSIIEDAHGAWMEVDYFINSTGIETVKKIRETELGEATAKYIIEIVFAFARIDSKKLDGIALRELNYAAPGIANGALITFEDKESNFALRKTEEFQKLAPEILTTRVREKVHLYLKYVEKYEGVAA